MIKISNALNIFNINFGELRLNFGIKKKSCDVIDSFSSGIKYYNNHFHSVALNSLDINELTYSLNLSVEGKEKVTYKINAIDKNANENRKNLCLINFCEFNWDEIKCYYKSNNEETKDVKSKCTNVGTGYSKIEIENLFEQNNSKSLYIELFQKKGFKKEQNNDYIFMPFILTSHKSFCLTLELNLDNGIKKNFNYNLYSITPLENKKNSEVKVLYSNEHIGTKNSIEVFINKIYGIVFEVKN